jgi:hypothetical protein
VLLGEELLGVVMVELGALDRCVFTVKCVAVVETGTFNCVDSFPVVLVEGAGESVGELGVMTIGVGVTGRIIILAGIFELDAVVVVGVLGASGDTVVCTAATSPVTGGSLAFSIVVGVVTLGVGATGSFSGGNGPYKS